MRNSPSCSCCGDPQVCSLITDAFASDSGEWDEVSGTWTYSGTLNGSTDGATVVSDTVVHDGSQYLTLKIRANAADQVAEILFLTDATGDRGIAVRLTFGDSGVSGDCGTMQIFEDTAGHTGRIAVDDAQPVPALIDGVWINLTVMLDVYYSRMFVGVDVDTSPSAEKYVSLSANINPTRHDNKLGFRVVTGQSSSVDFDDLDWDRLVLYEASRVSISAYQCHSQDPCSSGSPWVDIATQWPWASFNTDCAYVTTGTSPNYTKVESQLSISAYDRSNGYTVQTLTKIRTDGYGGTLSVKLDDNGHEMLFQTGAAGGFGTRQLTLSLYKGVTLLDSHTAYYTIAALATVTATVSMCDDRVSGSVSWGVGAGNRIDLTSATTQVATGSDHEATVTGSGSLIQTFKVTRCSYCAFCVWCDDLEENRTGTVEIDVSDPAVDGTYAITGSGCSADYDDGSIEVILGFSRNSFGVTLLHGGDTSSGTSSVKSMPVDCEGISGEVVNLTGDWTGTATVTIT